MPMLQPSTIRRAWFKWKSLRLPWRKKFLVGFDLQGNTFWEFKDVLSHQPQRMRRIAHFPSTVPYSDISISPQWHQWLRHTRDLPPSMNEQSNDIARLETLKVLAAEADRRWAAKPGLLDHPGLEGREHKMPSPETRENKIPPNGNEQTIENQGSGIRQTRGKGPDDAIQKHHNNGSHDQWQPKPWEANVTHPRR